VLNVADQALRLVLCQNGDMAHVCFCSTGPALAIAGAPADACDVLSIVAKAFMMVPLVSWGKS
jgi:hypothetical protein